MFRAFITKKDVRILSSVACVGAALVLATLYKPSTLYSQEHIGPNQSTLKALQKTQKSLNDKSWVPPSRSQMLTSLQDSDSAPFDLLIIGGGATGVGCALDATTRGLKVALVERDDFSCGTSSRSTKLVHGGVRYLEKAFLEFDYDQYKLVVEALHERASFLKIAPYLAYELPIMLPIHQWYMIPYYYAGAKVYDLLAGSQALSASYFLSKKASLDAFPMLDNKKIKGAIVYFDGAHNDSRMNVAIAMTAVRHGAVVANHVEVLELIKKPRQTLLGKELGPEVICGALVKDTLSGKSWVVKAKGVINATGPFCGTLKYNLDTIRKMDTPGIAEIVAPSSGVHLVLPNYFSPPNMGLLDPNTSDGRVIFFLPWQGGTIAGTTDSPTTIDYNPIPSLADIDWILEQISTYLSPEIKVRRSDVQAAWSGIRPLVRDPDATSTAGLVRSHMINVSDSGLLTIAGGKWTTYRSMAEETIDKAIGVFGLEPTNSCETNETLLIGTPGWSKNLYIQLIQTFRLDADVAKNLTDSYGDRAWNVAQLIPKNGETKLGKGYPYIEAEIIYCCRNEYALTAIDFLARRTRLSFLNAKVCSEALPRVVEIMGKELGWDRKRKEKETSEALAFLKTMGLGIE